MSIIEVIVVLLIAVIMHELCITVINSINLCKPLHGKIKPVWSIHEYIKCSRRK